jgi:hypothetical protein
LTLVPDPKPRPNERIPRLEGDLGADELAEFSEKFESAMRTNKEGQRYCPAIFHYPCGG